MSLSLEDEAEILEQRIAARERLLGMAVTPATLALLDELQPRTITEHNRMRRLSELNELRYRLEEVRHEIELQHMSCDFDPCAQCRDNDLVRMEQP